MDTLEVKKIEPEVYAQKCPVCNGFGTVKRGELICQACAGSCYVLVPIKLESQNA